MANMRYCRFQNTARDFAECVEAVELEEELSREECGALRDMIHDVINLLEVLAERAGVDIEIPYDAVDHLTKYVHDELEKE